VRTSSRRRRPTDWQERRRLAVAGRTIAIVQQQQQQLQAIVLGAELTVMKLCYSASELTERWMEERSIVGVV
jgi:hypothetical protein